MKYITTLCLILLLGSPTIDQLKIASKYHANITFDVSEKSCSGEVTNRGCVVWVEGKPVYQWVRGSLDNKQFEKTMLHEVYHYFFGVDSTERNANIFADNLIEWRNNLK